MAVEKIEKW